VSNAEMIYWKKLYTEGVGVEGVMVSHLLS